MKKLLIQLGIALAVPTIHAQGSLDLSHVSVRYPSGGGTYFSDTLAGNIAANFTVDGGAVYYDILGGPIQLNPGDTFSITYQLTNFGPASEPSGPTTLSLLPRSTTIGMPYWGIEETVASGEATTITERLTVPPSATGFNISAIGWGVTGLDITEASPWDINIHDIQINVSTAAVPEPSTIALVAVGGLTIVIALRQKQTTAK